MYLLNLFSSFCNVIKHKCVYFPWISSSYWLQVRLILSPLLNLYSLAANCGDASLTLAFSMLASLVGTMDRLAVGTYHSKIYEHCLAALDLRRQHPDSLKNINMVEQSIIHAIISLTMKLTEGTFRPLFLRTLEWAEAEVDESSSKKSLDRAIVFYKLVNKLAEKHRYLHNCIKYYVLSYVQTRF
jgi:U3 small nucleolar RNA-associated protein 10